MFGEFWRNSSDEIGDKGHSGPGNPERMLVHPPMWLYLYLTDSLLPFLSRSLVLSGFPPLHHSAAVFSSALFFGRPVLSVLSVLCPTCDLFHKTL